MASPVFQGKTQRYGKIILTILLSLALFFFILAGYKFNWSWTGFDPSIGPQVQQYQSGKTLWDWLQLLIVPLLLIIGATWFTARQNHDRELADKQHEHDNQLTADNQREVALQTYIDHMSGLLLEKNLRSSKSDDEVRKIATARTLTVLPNFDAQRKRSVIKFLRDAQLIKAKDTVIDLMEADLSKADLGRGKIRELNLLETELTFVDLSGANLKNTQLRKSSLMSSVLFRADLREADLSEASLFMTNFIEANLRKAKLIKADLTGAWLARTDLREADLSDAHMFQADLRKADLTLAKIDNADLSEANLTGAIITETQLKLAKSLKDAIMPDGSKHP